MQINLFSCRAHGYIYFNWKASQKCQTVSSNLSCTFKHFHILASDANKFRLLMKENLLIKRDQSQLNKNIKSFPLKLFNC